MTEQKVPSHRINYLSRGSKSSNFDISLKRKQPCLLYPEKLQYTPHAVNKVAKFPQRHNHYCHTGINKNENPE